MKTIFAAISFLILLSIITKSAIAVGNRKTIISNTSSTITGDSLYVAIPDINFEYALIKLKIDNALDGKLLIANAQKVTSLNVPKSNISSLQGIEVFINLAELDCRWNKLINLDLSKNTALISLSCYSNSLLSLDVSKNIALRYLNCSDNVLKNLNVDKNIAIEQLLCYDNRLTNLDVNNNVKMEFLNCQNNCLESLDLSKNIALSRLVCNTNYLNNLDVSKNIKLNYLKCKDNSIQTIRVNSLKQRTINWAQDDFVSYIDSKGIRIHDDVEINVGEISYLEKKSEKKLLDASKTAQNNQKKENSEFSHIEANINSYIDIPDENFEKALVYFYIDDVLDGKLLKENAIKVTSLNIINWNIINLQGINAFINLVKLSCSNNKLTILDLSNNPHLTYLNCSYNNLGSLNISKNSNLTYLDCSSNSLASLNVSKNTQLSKMDCSSNRISTICINSYSQRRSSWQKNYNASYKVCK